MKDRITVHHGDSREVLKTFAVDSFDSCVTDPPYALTSIVKRFGKASLGDDTQTSDRSRRGADGYARAARGFMGQEWDNGSTAFDPDFWREVFRVLKPGAHVVAFSGTRTYHRMACAIEDAGFEIRDQVGWLFGSGFPKSHNIGDGWGTALKPAWEPICLARKPLIGTVAANVLQRGTGAINVDACRTHAEDAQGGDYTVKRLKPGATLNETGGNWRPEDGPEYQGHQKPGRWPANVIHDGSEEVVAAFPQTESGSISLHHQRTTSKTKNTYGERDAPPEETFGDSGSAARFFYTAKADSDDRLGSKHPTVKPVDLMQYLIRLVTPKGGLVLDPFAGTGTTGEAAFREGMRAVLIEREARFVKDIERRISLLMAGPDQRLHESVKASGRVSDPGPLFGGLAEPIGGGDAYTESSRTNNRSDRIAEIAE